MLKKWVRRLAGILSHEDPPMPKLVLGPTKTTKMQSIVSKIY